MFVDSISIRRSLCVITGVMSSAGSLLSQAPTPAATKAPAESIFAPLILSPSPSVTRAANGAPGAKYWQNAVDYRISASLDTISGSVQASMAIRYHNNSPDTLKEIWVHLEQNRFKGTGPQPGDGQRLVRHGDQYGYNIVSVQQVHEQTGPVTVPMDMDPKQSTLGKIAISSPIAPGESTTIWISYYFYVPPAGNRMGRDFKEGKSYALAQWYPRVVVYDDIKGWNLDPYRGSGEFYSHLGNFHLEVTVPSNYIVAATGSLVNKEEVLTATQISRLEMAMKSDTSIAIIKAGELNDGSARPTNNGTLTWKFQAENVRDGVWAASPNYRWDASSWEGILTQAFYRGPSAASWSKAADMTRFSVKGYSELLGFKYPYPHMTSIETPEGGMEYPMMTFINAYKDIPVLFEVISHEVGHIWFPMIVNSNERMYPWMDEGIDQFLNTFVDATRFPEKGDQEKRALATVRMIDVAMTKKTDIASSIPPDEVARNLLGYQAYRKPAAVFQMLRSEVLGPELFDKALKAYMNRWAYKHPAPADLIRTFEDVTKRDLSWFWRQFIYEAPLFDQSVESVEVKDGGSVLVTYANMQRGILPVIAKITFSDGTTAEKRHSAEVWKENAEKFQATYETGGKAVVKVELDPEKKLVDLNRNNNTWAQ